MAWNFPVIGSIELDNLNIDETSHTVSLAPDRESGDLLLLLMARDGGTDNPSTPSGWTQLISDGFGAGVTCDCWYKTSDGTEPDTITVSAVDAEMFASVCINIKAGTWSGTPEVGTLQKVNTSSGDPPSVTPSWGTASTLWIAFMARESNAVISSYPAGFPQYRRYARANSGNGATMNVCADVEEAASKDPGTFSSGAGRNSVSGTIAIKPAVGVAGTAAKMVKQRHGGMLVPQSLQGLNFSPGLSDRPELSSTYSKVAFAGKFHHPQGAGSYDISRVGFYFGGFVTKTGGSGLTVSLQSVDQTQSILTPSGTQDQTIDIANSDADFTTYSWYRTGTLSSNRTISHGDYVALVIEWDSSGHQGSDLVRFRQALMNNDENSSRSMRYNGASWSTFGYIPNCVFEMTDGSFGSFSNSLITDNFGTYQYDNADSPDEYANSYTPQATVKVDAFHGIFKPPTSEDLELVIYEGTTVIHTTTVSGWQIGLDDNHYWTARLDQEVQLEAHTKYYLALKPTQGTTTCKVYYRSVDDTNHFGIDPYSFGTETAYSRTDGGAWTQIPLRQLMLGVRVSSIDNGGTHGAFHPLGGN